MPVTARLSSRFYERFGDETTNELVNWLNAVDAEFRSELRDRDDRNWDRYRAELRSEVSAARGDLKTEIAAMRTELKGDVATLRVEMHSLLRSQLRWMFGFWISTLLAIAGLKFL